MDENDLYPKGHEQERKLFLLQTEAYIDQKQYETVLDLAQARLKRIPGDLDARIVICRVWLQQGRLDEARDMLREMEEIIASLSQIYACMGDICMKKGMKDSAETLLPEVHGPQSRGTAGPGYLREVEGHRRPSRNGMSGPEGRRRRMRRFPPISRR